MKQTANQTIDYEQMMLRLRELSEPEYAAFSRKTNPTAHAILGVRVPYIRKLAKEYYGYDFANFYEAAKEGTLEEQMLCALFIAQPKLPLADKLLLLDDFVPRIADWAVNDMLTGALKLKEPDKRELFMYLEKYVDSAKEYEQRFAVVTMLSHFLMPEYGEAVMERVDRIGQEKYYSQMAVAWLLATGMAECKIPEITEAYIYGDNHLPRETLRMTVRKCYDSYRVSRERYERLRAYSASKNV